MVGKDLWVGKSRIVCTERKAREVEVEVVGVGKAMSWVAGDGTPSPSKRNS